MSRILRPDPHEIARTIETLFRAGDVEEVRIPGTQKYGTISGYFDDHRALTKAILSQNGDFPGIYVTINPVNPDLLARAKNHLRLKARETTADKEILFRRRLLIDCDPVRPRGISSTDAEHEAAIQRARDIAMVQTEKYGWPAPIIADSGNGGHLLYLIDLPNDELSNELVKDVLKALALRFDDEHVTVDKAVSNAARITKAYGTPTRKGDDLPERPHRLSRILDVPPVIEVVSREQLEKLAQTPKPAADEEGHTRPPRGSRFDIDAFLARHLAAREPVPYEDGRKWVLEYCPFDREHRAPDAAVFQYVDGSLGFNCFHDSCAQKTWKDVRERFEPRESRQSTGTARSSESTDKRDDAGEDGLPQIQANDRPFRNVCQDGLAALNRKAFNDPPLLFTRTGHIVAINVTELGQPFIVALDDVGIRHYLSRAADFYAVGMRGRKEVPPSIGVAKDILARNPAGWGFPVLKAIIEAPTLRLDGSVLAKPGYDPASGLYYAPSPALANVEIPDQPCRDHIDIALDLIRDVLRDFPFIDKASFANVLGAMITAVCRSIIDGPVPLALFDATAAGTGKTLLAEIIALILTGRPAQLVSAPAEAEEWRKQLTSILIEAPPLVVFDNVNCQLSSSELSKVLTAETHCDRILGRHQTVTVPVRCSWIATGNNLQLGGDLPRRCFWVRMDAGCSDPSRRTDFRHERLKDYVLHHRKDLLVALLTLARAWFAVGQPRASVPLMGSFERWTEVVAGILEYAQVEGFLANIDELTEQCNAEQPAWEAFLGALEKAFAGSAFTVTEVWNRLNEKDEETSRRWVFTDGAQELRNALPGDLTGWMDQQGKFNQRLGIAFSQRRSRRFGSRQLRVERDTDDSHSKVARWKVLADA